MSIKYWNKESIEKSVKEDFEFHEKHKNNSNYQEMKKKREVDFFIGAELFGMQVQEAIFRGVMNKNLKNKL